MFRVARFGLFLNLGDAFFGTRVACTNRQTEENMLQPQAGSLSLKRQSGWKRLASKRTGEPTGSLSPICITTLAEDLVGHIYDRDGYTFCAFTQQKADHFKSWFSRQYTQEETEREKEAFFFSLGYVRRMEILHSAGRTEEGRISTDLSQGS